MRTVGDVIRVLFPHGTRVFQGRFPANADTAPPSRPSWPDDGSSAPWPPCPDYPPDLFAAAAYLLEVAGAYHYLTPGTHGDDESEGTQLRRGESRQAQCKRLGEEWRPKFDAPADIQHWWDELGSHKDEKTFVSHVTGKKLPEWWGIACDLLITADHACADISNGLTGRDSGKASSMLLVVRSARDKRFSRLLKGGDKNNKIIHLTPKDQLANLCVKIDPEVACVQPKMRSKDIGCTIRNLSLHLALLPPRGIARTVWHQPYFNVPKDDDAALNILLIPYPFDVPAKAFEGRVRLDPQTVRNEPEYFGALPWGVFTLNQTWLHGVAPSDRKKVDPSDQEKTERRQALVTFTHELIMAAKRDVKTVHGLVFPEYALDWNTYSELVALISQKHPDIEFLVAGSSENCQDEKGNFVISTSFGRDKSQDDTDQPVCISTSRPKHHRWRLDESQISAYALASALDPRVLWWEDIPLPKREVHVNVLRDASTFAPMICEDLARVDPCHPILRAMAPNLVFVLLMDGPQLPIRWSARYATHLAEDPGSSVLTFTSLALVQRSNTAREGGPNWSVALWKDDSGRTVPIQCEPSNHGVVLSLSGYRTTEISLDGRSNTAVRSWRYHGHQPIRITEPSPAITAADPKAYVEDIVKLVTGAYDRVPSVKKTGTRTGFQERASTRPQRKRRR